MNTIVQEYGPIYGEPVNGTVLGRPNGSVYVPISNTIEISCNVDTTYLIYNGISYIATCLSDGNIAGIADDNRVVAVATSQDLASYMQYQVFYDSALTSEVGHRDVTAGIFNYSYQNIAVVDSPPTFSDGDTLYVRAQLMNNGVPVATSNVIELKAVVP